MNNKVTRAFLEAKVQELMEAAVKLQERFCSSAEIQEHTSLNNNMRECYLKVGILEEGEKVGKSRLYRVNPFNINVANVHRAYTIKATLRKNREASDKAAIIARVAEREGFTPKVTTTKVEKPKVESIFPTLEDCLSFLKHHYGIHHEVLFVPEGHTLKAYTIEKI